MSVHSAPGTERHTPQELTRAQRRCSIVSCDLLRPPEYLSISGGSTSRIEVGCDPSL
jgi:hypothetical protein